MRRYLYNIIVRKPRNPFEFILQSILSVLSFLYLLSILLRHCFYKIGIFKAVRLKAPVVSVGNITWGGTGKTPLVETICLYFSSQGKRVTLLMRGYGDDEDRAFTEDMPDVTVSVGKDRVRNAQLAEGEGRVDLFVLDDGFQHIRIKRNIDIVTVNATDPFGKGLLIPAGILREPISGLCRADIVVITKSDLVDKDSLNRIKLDILKVRPDIDIFEAIHQPVAFHAKGEKRLDLEYIKGKKVCALSGIGDNNSFIKTLQMLGADIKQQFLYMDHHRYTKEELEGIFKRCRQDNIATIVTTRKDWVKLKILLTADCAIEFLILRIKVKIDDEESFFRGIYPILSG